MDNSMGENKKGLDVRNVIIVVLIFVLFGLGAFMFTDIYKRKELSDKTLSTTITTTPIIIDSIEQKDIVYSNLYTKTKEVSKKINFAGKIRTVTFVEYKGEQLTGLDEYQYYLSAYLDGNLIIELNKGNYPCKNNDFGTLLNSSYTKIINDTKNEENYLVISTDTKEDNFVILNKNLENMQELEINTTGDAYLDMKSLEEIKNSPLKDLERYAENNLYLFNNKYEYILDDSIYYLTPHKDVCSNIEISKITFENGVKKSEIIYTVSNTDAKFVSGGNCA